MSYRKVSWSLEAVKLAILNDRITLKYAHNADETSGKF